MMRLANCFKDIINVIKIPVCVLMEKSRLRFFFLEINSGLLSRRESLLTWINTVLLFE